MNVVSELTGLPGKGSLTTVSRKWSSGTNWLPLKVVCSGVVVRGSSSERCVETVTCEVVLQWGGETTTYVHVWSGGTIVTVRIRVWKGSSGVGVIRQKFSG